MNSHSNHKSKEEEQQKEDQEQEEQEHQQQRDDDEGGSQASECSQIPMKRIESTEEVDNGVDDCDSLAWNHSILTSRDACDMERYDHRFEKYNTEASIEKLRKAHEAALSHRFGTESASMTFTTFTERTCPCEISDILIPSKNLANSSTRDSQDTVVSGVSSSDIRKSIHPRLSSSRNHYKAFQVGMFDLFDSYRDVFFSERTFNNDKSLREMYMLHVMNHLLKARSYILRHNDLLQKGKVDDEDVCRDQGYTRPKALILLPYRHHALMIVKLINTLACQPTRVGKKRDLRHRKRYDSLGMKL